MKPPWYQAGADAELEALQTDVMRFVAILGLCLAAIFSMVQSAVVDESVEEAIAPVARVAAAEQLPPSDSDAVSLDAAALPYAALAPAPETAVAAPVPSPMNKATAIEAAANPDRGFSLEFASDTALMELLATGQLRLFAQSQEQFWVLDPEAGTFSTAPAPSSYYRMLADTVPGPLQRKLAGATGGLAGDWGVRLTAQMVAQLQRIMREQSGGRLLIHADGHVALELK